MSESWQKRTEALLGETGMNRLKNSCVVVVGLGGVGSYAFEALVRVGVGKIVVIDHDVVDVTNINRQLVASVKTVGLDKVDVAKKHAGDINNEAKIIAIKQYVSKENFCDVIPKDADIIIDAIDSVQSKVDLIAYCKQNGYEIISSMGTANKLDPTKFEFADINKTSVDPLARVMRKKLKEIGIENVGVVYSTQKPTVNESDPAILGSVSYVPASAGLILASKAIEILLKGSG
jgi:tRNA threonylcarbamoyladenosine dehydratase